MLPFIIHILPCIVKDPILWFSIAWNRKCFCRHIM